MAEENPETILEVIQEQIYNHPQFVIEQVIKDLNYLVDNVDIQTLKKLIDGFEELNYGII